MNKVRSITIAMLLLVGLSAANDAARKLLQHADPQYPPVAARLNLHGTVKLRIWIAPDGSVRRVEYIGGHPLLAESALKSVRDWKFEPSPKETAQMVEVKF